MRVILEKADIVALLGKAMKRKLTESEVEVSADPFEVVIHDATGVLGDEDEAVPIAEQPVRHVKQESPVTVDEETSFEDLQRMNAEIAAQPPKTGKRVKKRERNLMPGESLTPRNPLEGDEG